MICEISEFSNKDAADGTTLPFGQNFGGAILVAFMVCQISNVNSQTGIEKITSKLIQEGSDLPIAPLLIADGAPKTVSFFDFFHIHCHHDITRTGKNT